MKSTFKYILFFLICVSCNSKDTIIATSNKAEIGKFIDDWTYEVFSNSQDNTSKQIFKLWVPNNVTPRAILVLAPGNFGNGLNLVKIQAWQEYAKKEKLALLGIYITPSLNNPERALTLAVTAISKERGLESMAKLPFLLRGHSSGGRFSADFSNYYPKRTIAFANIKGIFDYLPEESIPSLIIVGEKEDETRKEYLKTTFFSFREKKHLSCYAVEQNAGHGVGGSDELVKAFFSAILKKRLINGIVIDVEEETSLLGRMETLESFSFSNYPYDKQKASCLIDDKFSKEWIAFMQ